MSMLLPLLALAAPPQDTFGTHDPYHPRPDGPRLTTPQWIGEQGVEAVVVLSIDDMRAPEPYDRYMHLILERLEAIDGRAPVSVFVNDLDPGHPTLATWLERGLSLEVHTIDHPCPLLHASDLERARSTVERCIDLLNEVPNSSPVAYRMPCCDSINSQSPRFLSEILSGQTGQGNFLTIDTSVFTVFEGERFRQHVPADRSFVNTIESYPFPYMIGDRLWELPCMVPSDWEAQHLRGPNHPETVADLKAALDATVELQGVMTFVFHPHNWIQAHQVVELIDHAVETHGSRVKFLNLPEVGARLDAVVGPLRDPEGSPTGTRLVDLDGDGLHDVVRVSHSSFWRNGSWSSTPTPFDPTAAAFGRGPDGEARALTTTGSWRWLEDAWQEAPPAPEGGGHLRDLDGDGASELVRRDGVFRAHKDGGWTSLGFAPPVDPRAQAGTRFVDLDGDGLQDIVHSTEAGASVHRLMSMARGWTGGGVTSLPPITVNGTERGCWEHSEHLWWQNEDTAHLPNHVDRRSFTELLAAVTPPPPTPEEARSALVVEGGLEVTLAAAEPLVRDPVAFDWDSSGALYVVEMGDYPLGDTEVSGRVVKLLDPDGDWRYESATTFLDGLAFPTGIAPWRDGMLITCAPDILFARDTDGDGAADEIRIVATGFGEGNQQHRVNGLWWGLDNLYHGANGDSGGRVGGVELGGRDFALDPDTGKIHSELGQTQFGKTRDDWGNWFGGNNSHPAWHWPLSQRYLTRAPHVTPPPSYVSVVAPGETIQPLTPVAARFNDPGAARRFTSACSPMIYRDDDLPFAGDLFICEPVHNLVHRRRLSREGTRFVAATTQGEFLASRDPYFRPTMVRTGPDGAIWVSDMSRAVIEHPEWIPDDWEARLDLGEGRDRGRIFRIQRPAGEPSGFTWPATMDTTALVTGLEDSNGWMRDTSHRLLVERGEGAAELELLASTSASSLARLHALWVLAGQGVLTAKTLAPSLTRDEPGLRRAALRLAEPFSELEPQVLELGEDPSPSVRLQLAATLGAFPSQAAARTLARLLDRDGEDPYLRAAAHAALGPEMLAEARRGTTSTARRRELLALEARVTGDPRLVLASQEFTLAERAAILSELLVQDASFSILGLEGLVDEALDPASEVNLEDRVVILARAGEAVPDEALVELVLRSGVPPSLLTNREDPSLATLLVERWREVTPARRGALLDVLLARQAFVDVAVEALEAGVLEASGFDATRADLLVAHATDPLRARAALQRQSGNRESVVESMRAVLEPGDALRGREHFNGTCTRCHRLDGAGEAIGPDLRSLGDRSTEALLVAILDPNRAVEARYVSYTARTHDGRLFTGVVTDETDTSVTLRGAGVDQILLRTELAVLSSTGLSQMPEGLEVELGPGGLADVIAYLQGGALSPKEFAGNQPRPLPVIEHSELRASDAEIHGPSLVYETLHGNLGYWHALDDLATWTLDVQTPGRFAVEVEIASPSNPGANALVLTAAGSTLTWPVNATGSWDSYELYTAGMLDLPAGRVLLGARAAPGLEGYLLDLRRIRLRRVE